MCLVKGCNTSILFENIVRNLKVIFQNSWVENCREVWSDMMACLTNRLNTCRLKYYGESMMNVHDGECKSFEMFSLAYYHHHEILRIMFFTIQRTHKTYGSGIVAVRRCQPVRGNFFKMASAGAESYLPTIKHFIQSS